MPHSAVPSSSRGAAACSTFIKVGKEKFSFPSPLPEPAEREPPLNKEEVTAVALAMRPHKMRKLSQSFVPTWLLHGGWQEQRPLSSSLRRLWVAEPSPTPPPSHPWVSGSWGGCVGGGPAVYHPYLYSWCSARSPEHQRRATA